MRWNSFVVYTPVLLVCSLWASDSSLSFVHKQKYAMGSVFDIVAYDPSPMNASSAIDAAFAEIVRLDLMMSDYRENSDLNRLNATAGLHAEPVPRDLYKVIEESLKYSRLSKGKFDITVGPLVTLWKAALAGGRPPSDEQETAARACIGYEKLVLVPPNRVGFRSRCVHIDVGAIGKGYAVDRAAEILRKWGIRSALIDAGGSTIYAMGSPPGREGWLVHMRDPSDRIDPAVTLLDESISTSEQTARSYLTNSAAGHIIDPATGLPIRTKFAVSVVTKTATSSDALSTTLLLAGPGEGSRIIRRTSGAAAIWVSPKGEVRFVSTGPKISTRTVDATLSPEPASSSAAVSEAKQ
jgi:thiamine biosynthesis lipoprotein